ncbi:MAG: ABC transporter substrate-binding protein [Xanthobacteraceae bacterium]
MHRRALLQSAVAGAATLLTGRRAFAADPVKIGFMHSFSGYLAPVGVACRDGFTVGIGEINDGGGINGRKLEAIFENDESDTSKGVPAAIRLMNNQKVAFFVGPGRSDVTEALGPMLTKAQIPSITLSVVLPTAQDYTFAGSPAVTDEAKLLIDFVKKQGGKTIAVLSAIDLYDKTFGIAAIEEAKRQGIEVVASESYNAVSDKSFIPQLSRFKAANAEWMLLAGPLSGLILKQKAEVGYTGKVVGNILFPAQGLQSLLQIAGPALEGSYFTATQSMVWDTLPKDDPRQVVTTRFREEFNKRLGRYPEAEKMGYGQGYDAAFMLADALKRAGPDAKGPQLKAAMEQISGLMGANGAYTFTKDSHASNSGYVIASIKGKSFVLIGG